MVTFGTLKLPDWQQPKAKLIANMKGEFNRKESHSQMLDGILHRVVQLLTKN